MLTSQRVDPVAKKHYRTTIIRTEEPIIRCRGANANVQVGGCEGLIQVGEVAKVRQLASADYCPRVCSDI